MSIEERYKVKGYYPTIGIECHVQLKTKTKLFASVSNEARTAEPNTLISHICFGLPGALPVLNEEAVRLASKAAFALGTAPQKFSKFDRKHYFYPDLPLGYQITQFDEPIILGGSIEVALEDGTKKTIDITRAHLEADAGKSTHPVGGDYSLVDLNRAGTPLLEIVSEPVMHNAIETKAFAKELWLRMQTAGVSDADLYHGNMRFDVNVSVSKDPAVLGTRSETKNLNSFRSVERAVDYEVARQIKLLEKGDEVDQETRGWVDDEQKTVSQRSKEDAHDYRYFPDPDLPPVVLTDEYIAKVESEVPVMPDVWREKLSTLGLDYLLIETLLESQAEYETDFLELVTNQPSAKQGKAYANWIANIEVPQKKLAGVDDPILNVDDAHRRVVFDSAYQLQSEGTISSNGTKKFIDDALTQWSTEEVKGSSLAIAEGLGIVQVSDAGEMDALVQKILDDNPGPVAELESGEMKVVGYLVGQAMKASQGKANPAMVKQIIADKLNLSS